MLISSVMIRSTEENQARMSLFLQLKHVIEKAHNEIAVINNHQRCVSKREKRDPRREMRRGRSKDKKSIQKTGNEGKGRAEIQPMAKRKVQQYLVSWNTPSFPLPSLSFPKVHAPRRRVLFS